MEIVFIGGKTSDRELVERMCRFAAKRLLPRVHSRLFLKIEFEDNLYSDHSIFGDCIWESAEPRPKDYILRFDSSLSTDDLLVTAAHEMVHVKQYATGELKQYSNMRGYRYKNDFYPLNYNLIYRPWEIEAAMLENVLVDEFHKSVDEILT